MSTNRLKGAKNEIRRVYRFQTKYKNLLDNKTLVLVFIFLLVFILKFPILNTPHIRDGISVYIGPAMSIRDAGLNPLYLGIHPPVFYEFLAVTLKVFGESLVVTHIFSLVFTVLFLFYTYLLGKLLYNSVIGLTAAVALFFTPLVFARSGLVQICIPLAVFSIMAVYYYLKNKTLLYVVSGSLLVLTKEPGVLIIGGILLYSLIVKTEGIKKISKDSIKSLLVHSIPIIFLIAWFIINKFVQGWIFHPAYLKFFDWRVFPHEFLRRLHQLFFSDYHFIPTAAVILCLLPLKEFYQKNKRGFFITLTLSLISFVTLYLTVPILSLIKERLKYSLIELTGKNLQGFYELRFSITCILFLGLFFLFYPKCNSPVKKLKLRFSKVFKKEALLLVICTGIVIIFFSFMQYAYQTRNIFMIYPFFFVMGIAALKESVKRETRFLIVICIILALFITQWYAPRPVFQTCEENMGYLDMIDVHVRMSKFIEENYGNKIILTEVPELDELQAPFGGYIIHPLKVIELEDDPWTRGIKEELAIPSREKFDLVYFSNGGTNERQLVKVIDFYNLTLIKKFEKNGKISYLYG